MKSPSKDIMNKKSPSKDIMNKGFTEDMIMKSPSKDIMNKLSRSVLSLYSYDDNPDDLSVENLLLQSVKLIGAFPSIVANAYAVKRHYFEAAPYISTTPRRTSPPQRTSCGWSAVTRTTPRRRPTCWISC